MPKFFDDIPLRDLAKDIAEVIGSHDSIDRDAIPMAFRMCTGIEIPRSRRRLFGRFVSSAKGRGYIEETRVDSGEYCKVGIPAEPNLAFADESFSSICDLVRLLDPEQIASIDQLTDLTLQVLIDRGCQDKKLVRSTVSSAIWATGRRNK